VRSWFIVFPSLTFGTARSAALGGWLGDNFRQTRANVQRFRIGKVMHFAGAKCKTIPNASFKKAYFHYN
jgi:hypothetical protein